MPPNFEKVGVQVSVEGANLFSKQSQEVNDAMEKMNKISEKVSKESSKSWENHSQSASIGSAAIARATIIATTAYHAFNAAIKQVVDVTYGMNSRLEQSQIAFEVLSGDAQAAGAMINFVTEYASRSTFGYEKVLKASTQLIRYGFSLKEAKELVELLGNVAAAAGDRGADAFDRAAYALGQMNAAGKVMGDDLRQLKDAGVSISNVFQIMARNTGKSIGELVSLEKQGKLSSIEFLKAFKEWSQANFGDMMERQLDTAKGALANLSTNIKIFASSAFKPLYDRFGDIIKRAAELSRSDDFDMWAARTAAYVEFVASQLERLPEIFMISFKMIYSIVSSIGKLIYTALQWINPFVRHSPSLVEQVQEGARQIAEAYSQLGKSIPSSISNATNAIMRLSNVSSAAMQQLEQEALKVSLTNMQVFSYEVPAAYMEALHAIEAMRVELDVIISRQTATLREYSRSVDDVKNAVETKSRAIKEAERALKPYENILEDANDELQKARDNLEKYRDGLDIYRQAVDKSRNALEKHNEIVDVYTSRLN